MELAPVRNKSNITPRQSNSKPIQAATIPVGTNDQEWRIRVGAARSHSRFLSPGQRQAERLAKCEAGKRHYDLYPFCPRCGEAIAEYASWHEGQPKLGSDGRLYHPHCEVN